MVRKAGRKPRSEKRSRFRSLLVRMLMIWHDVTQKQLGAALGETQSKLSQHLSRGEVKDGLFERILQAMRCRPVVVLILTACLDTLEALARAADLTEDELLVIERAAQGSARRTREGLIEIARLSRRTGPAGYPGALDLKPLRRRAEELWAQLKERPASMWTAVVEAVEEYQGWAFCEKVCELSVREASRELKRAMALARLAVMIAERVQGPDGWTSRVRGYATAHLANILRVAGHLKEADTLLEQAKQLWEAGDDPAGVLDPERLLHFEAALRRDQRRFDEALFLLDQAAAPGSRYRGRALVSKGFTLEVMGEYERAIQALLEAVPLINREVEPRQANILNLNLATNLCNLGRYAEATDLIESARAQAIDLGDEIDLARIPWLEGRITAGQGRTAEALVLLKQARRKFAVEKMFYDVALALLEEAVLLMAEARTPEVKELARELTEIFNTKGVHREALAALRLFQEAVERETATVELARRVLRYLYRARYDPGLPFTAL